MEKSTKPRSGATDALWGIWMENDKLLENCHWMIAGVGRVDGPELYTSREDAEEAIKYWGVALAPPPSDPLSVQPYTSAAQLLDKERGI